MVWLLLQEKITKSSLNFIRLLRVVIIPSVVERENDSKQSDEFQAKQKEEVSLLI